MGMITPLGHSVAETWDNILTGKSGVGIITRFDANDYNVRIAAEVKDWQPERYVAAKEVRRTDTYQQFIHIAAKEAIAHSGMTVTEQNRRRTSVIIGSSVGGVTSYYEQAKLIYDTGDPRRISPFGIPMFMVNGGSDNVAIDLGAQGPSYTPVSACATGADCIGVAFDLIRLGRMDQALAGAGDAPIFPIGIAAFDRTGACSRENDTPLRAVRPFSKDRPGLVFAEGAGVLALEELEHAKARGATIYGEIVGYATNSDAFHITAPQPDGLGAAYAIEMALADAQMTVEDIDYINAHGTGTGLNDAMETKAVKHVFGARAYQVPMSSTKSMTGHGMGATAAMEAVFALLAIRDQVAPPTINLDEADPECDLDYVPHQPRSMAINAVMSNSFGFGGHNVSLILRRFVG
jgi:beta-ketoacyl-acyl-carrier-protein synthase II